MIISYLYVIVQADFKEDFGTDVKFMKTPLSYLRSYRELARLEKADHFKAGHTPSKVSIAEAKRLHAKIYLHRGYVGQDDVGKDKALHKRADPYQEHSNYFVVRNHLLPNKPIVATARQIHHVPKLSHSSFPTIKELELYPEMKQMILALDPAKCVEISGLAKDHGVASSAPMVLYRALWHHSLRRHHHIWLMACDAKVFKNLKFLFGSALTRIGDNTFYMGSEVVPAMLEVHRSIDPLMQDARSLNPFKRRMKRMLVRFFMSGLSVKFQQLEKNSVIPSREIAKAVDAKAL